MTVVYVIMFPYNIVFIILKYRHNLLLAKVVTSYSIHFDYDNDDSIYINYTDITKINDRHGFWRDLCKYGSRDNYICINENDENVCNIFRDFTERDKDVHWFVKQPIEKKPVPLPLHYFQYCPKLICKFFFDANDADLWCKNT